MKRVVAIVSTMGLAACNGAARPREPVPAPRPAPPPDPPISAHVEWEGTSLDVSYCDASCLAARRASCTAAWRFDEDQGAYHRTYHVSAAGVARVDLDGRHLFGIDGRAWLECVDRCPGSDATPVCFPSIDHKQHAPVVVDLAGCKASSTTATRWEGHEATQVHLECADEPARDLTVVAELRPARDATIAAGLADSVDVPPELDGLVVSERVGDHSMFALSNVTAEDCAAFAWPAGARVSGSPDDFRAALAMVPALSKQSFDDKARLAERVKHELRRALGTKIRTACPELPAEPSDADAARCVTAHPELVGEVQQEFVTRHGDDWKQIRADDVTAPLCARFAPLAPPPK